MSVSAFAIQTFSQMIADRSDRSMKAITNFHLEPTLKIHGALFALAF
jgi:hypothetical protein